MEFEGITTSGLNCSSQIQPSDQTSSRFIDRFIRLKNRYWNRGFLITLLTLAGLTIQAYQYHSLLFGLEKSKEERYNVDYFRYGLWIGYIPGGVLATVQSAHKVFGISFIISYILQIMETMNYLKAYMHIISLFCIGMALAISTSAFHRIYTLWMPLNKQSLSHVPIILWMMVVNNKLPIYHYGLTYTRKVLGIVGIAWFVLWLIVVSGDRSQSPNRGFILFRLFRDSNTTPLPTGTNVVSLTRPTISGIPWKSFCTSMPVIALVLSYMCHANFVLLRLPLKSNESYFEYVQPFNKPTTILLLLTLALFELIPEITVFISITCVRKIFSGLYFVSMATIYYPDDIFLYLDNNKFVYLFYYFMPYFCLFGFKTNHLDIAPQYASVLYGILMTIYSLTWYSLSSILQNILIFEDLHHLQILWFLLAVISLAVAAFYAIFASAELQPWAVDIPVKEKRRNMQEEVNLMAV